MAINRRSALGMLGLASAATAITGEALARPLLPAQQFRFSINARIGDALRKLADDIDAGGTYVESAGLNSQANVDDFLFHTLTVKFVFKEGGIQIPVR